MQINNRVIRKQLRKLLRESGMDWRDSVVLSVVALALLLMLGSYVAARLLFWQWW